MSDQEKNESVEMPPPASKKRKKSIAPSVPPAVSLPPPLMPYHPHLVPSYFPVYHQHPYYLAVGPQRPASPSISPTLYSTSTPTSSTTAPTQHPRILPKSLAPTPPPVNDAAVYNIYPYPIQLSPQSHPITQGATSPQLPKQSSTTADEREQARKVSHSAIERRRREKINDKIMQLKQLIPSCTDRDNLHKMTVLQSAIDYIAYLKKTIESLEEGNQKNSSSIIIAPFQQQQQMAKSMLPKEVERFTHQFSVSEKPAAQQEEEDDNWSSKSSSPIPSTSLKPIDLINMNKKMQDKPLDPETTAAPDTVTRDQSDTSTSSTDRHHMNLENILC